MLPNDHQNSEHTIETGPSADSSVEIRANIKPRILEELS